MNPPDGTTAGVRRIIILGALSAIAEAAARQWAAERAHLLLAGRHGGRLKEVAADLTARGAHVETWTGDLAATDAEAAFGEMTRTLGGVDVVLVAYGSLGDQSTALADNVDAQRILSSNFTSTANWCLAASKVLEAQRSGTLIVIGSVAGDRGRASNFVYGAAKGGLAILVQGIAHHLAGSGARAVLVKPGFVDTPMTAHIARKGLLWAKPEAIASTIVNAAQSGSRTGPVVYAPAYWRLIMLAIRSIPSAIFHKTRL